MKLSRVFLLILLTMGLLPIGVAAYLLISHSTEALTTNILERHRERAKSVAGEVERHTRLVTEGLKGYASLLDIGRMRDNERHELMRFILGKQSADLDLITLWTDKGAAPIATAFIPSREESPTWKEHEKVVKRFLMEVGMDEPTREGIRVFTSDAYLVQGSTIPNITVVVRTVGKGAQPITLAAEVRLAPIQLEIAGSRIGARGVTYIVDKQARLIAHPNLEKLLAPDEMIPWEIKSIIQARNASGTKEFEDAEGEKLLGAWAPISSLGWTVVVAEPKEDALSALRAMRWGALLISLAAGLIAFAAAVLLARSLSRPIQTMVGSALAIARGSFGRQIPVHIRNELGELAHTFNYMSSQLAEYDKESKQLYEELERGYLETIRALANSIDAKDPYTRGHSQRVTELSVAIAREIGLSDEEVRVIQYGAILHDIGKIGIRDEVLRKESPLTDDEYTYMKSHPVLGVHIIEPIDFLSDALDIVKYHHERFDGKGYPDGLAGTKIPVGARIVNITDSYDAMVTQRPYNVPLSLEQAIKRLQAIAGSQTDPDLTEAFLRVLERRRVEAEEGRVWRAQHLKKSDAAPTPTPDMPSETVPPAEKLH